MTYSITHIQYQLSATSKTDLSILHSTQILRDLQICTSMTLAN